MRLTFCMESVILLDVRRLFWDTAKTQSNPLISRSKPEKPKDNPKNPIQKQIQIQIRIRIRI